MKNDELISQTNCIRYKTFLSWYLRSVVTLLFRGEMIIGTIPDSPQTVFFVPMSPVSDVTVPEVRSKLLGRVRHLRVRLSYAQCWHLLSVVHLDTHSTRDRVVPDQRGGALEVGVKPWVKRTWNCSHVSAHTQKYIFFNIWNVNVTQLSL